MHNELKAFFHEGIVEAGCDEAGRGCLAGPVFAAAVILPPDFSNPLLNDSKQVTETNRNKLRLVIEQQALCWAVGICSQEEIDKINILNASFLAMHRAIEKLTITPHHLLIDGNRFKPYNDIKHTCIIKGDSLYKSIAAASILAKTHRDEYMEAIDKDYPQYNWKGNKGYPTLQHREAIQELGLTHHHRKSFNSSYFQLKLSI
jgi:ribonuclease HII